MDILVWSLIAISLCLAAALTFFVWRTRRLRRAATESQPAPSASLPNDPESAGLHIDKNVQFTVYRPETVVPEKWYPLLAFAHLSERRAGATDQEPDPIQEVREQAERILREQPAKYETAKLDRAFSVPRKGMLTFVPLVEGCEFNPPSQSILWQKDVHKVEFEMMASNAVDGRAVEGQVTIYLGSLILAEVALRIKVDSQYAPQSEQKVVVRADPYRKIFASYSHRDQEIVEDFEEVVQALGDQFLRDVKTLRSGEVWSEQLEQMIRDANIFQLFWSSNSMISEFVKQEWEYALSLNRANFIRPVYWEKRFPEKKPDLPPETLRRLHFHRLPTEEEEKRSAVIPPVPAPGGSDAPDDQGPSDTERVIAISTKPVPAPAPVKLERRRIPIKALTTAALGVLLAAVLLPIATIQYFRTGGGANTNSNTSFPTPSSDIAVNVDIDPVAMKSVPGSDGRRYTYRGQSGSYDLVVKNEGSYAISDVSIVERLSPGLEYVSSTPAPARQANQLVEWKQSQIRPHGEMRIRIFIRLTRNLKAEEELTTQQTITFRGAGGDLRTIRSTKTPLRRL